MMDSYSLNQAISILYLSVPVLESYGIKKILINDLSRRLDLCATFLGAMTATGSTMLSFCI